MSDVRPTDMNQRRATPTVRAGNYRVDPEKSGITFRAKAFGLLWVHGSIPAAEGAIGVVDGQLNAEGELAADELSTRLAPRDWHLRTSHYLYTRAHPRISVSIDSARLGTGEAECTVIVRDTPSVVPVTVTSIEAVDGALHIEATAVVDRKPFPMLGSWAGVSRRVHISVSLVARPTDV